MRNAPAKKDIAKEVDRIIDSYGGKVSGSVGILQDIQHMYRYLPKDALEHVSKRLGIPLSQVYSLSTFYKAFTLKPRGKHLISVCMGTACHVRASSRVLEAIQRELDIAPGRTTDDHQFSLETVNCLGACALGPLMVIDGEYHGQMTPKKVTAILKKYKDTSESINKSGGDA